MEFWIRVAHVGVTFALVLVIALLGRWVARVLRQPEVIGEIALGLLIGPVLVAVVGADAFGRLVPGDVLAVLKFLAQIGLVLFLVGLTHRMRRAPAGSARGAVGWVTFGGSVPSFLLGALFGVWVLLTQDGGVRGSAPAPAFLVFVAVALAVSAVPVLARILADRKMVDSPVGWLALASAGIIDTAGWLLLTVAVGLSTGSLAGLVRTLLVLAGTVVVALVIRRVLRLPAAARSCARWPRWSATVLGAVALAGAFGVEHLGLSVIFGALLVGLAIPAEEDTRWGEVVATVSRAGRTLVPAFFVVTGITVLTKAFTAVPWTVVLLVTVLGMLGKVGGGYLGARLAGESRPVATRVGVLLNTRGLTELIVLEIGYHAHILSGPLYLAFVVMALSTTALTGPLLTLLDRLSAARPMVQVAP
ncbi:cation:proton antiporter [Actinophytocola sediminis]